MHWFGNLKEISPELKGLREKSWVWGQWKKLLRTELLTSATTISARKENIPEQCLNMMEACIIQWSLTMQESLFFSWSDIGIERFHVFILGWGKGPFLVHIIPSGCPQGAHSDKPTEHRKVGEKGPNSVTLPSICCIAWIFLCFPLCREDYENQFPVII